MILCSNFVTWIYLDPDQVSNQVNALGILLLSNKANVYSEPEDIWQQLFSIYIYKKILSTRLI